MDSLSKKLSQLTGSLKQVTAVLKPSKAYPGLDTQSKLPRGPKQPKGSDAFKPTVIPNAPKIPGNAPPSQKDPLKVAEQVTDKEARPKAIKDAKKERESLKISKRGQWSIQKKS